MEEETSPETPKFSPILDRLLFLLPFLSFLLTMLLVRGVRRDRKPLRARYVPPSLVVTVAERSEAHLSEEARLSEPPEEADFEKKPKTLLTPAGTKLNIVVTLKDHVDIRDTVVVDVGYSYFIGQTHHSTKIGRLVFSQGGYSQSIQTPVPVSAASWENVAIEAAGTEYHNNVSGASGTQSQPINTGHS